MVRRGEACRNAGAGNSKRNSQFKPHEDVNGTRQAQRHAGLAPVFTGQRSNRRAEPSTPTGSPRARQTRDYSAVNSKVNSLDLSLVTVAVNPDVSGLAYMVGSSCFCSDDMSPEAAAFMPWL
jgi:hypothetical protein